MGYALEKHEKCQCDSGDPSFQSFLSFSVVSKGLSLHTKAFQLSIREQGRISRSRRLLPPSPLAFFLQKTLANESLSTQTQTSTPNDPERLESAL